jgi:hypothetical protein
MTVRVAALGELRAQTIAAVTPLETGPSLTLSLQYKLRSVNEWNGRHWGSKRGKHAETLRWQTAISNAIALSLGVPVMQQLLSSDCGVPNATGACAEHRTVRVQRLAPKVRNFIRDDDNLAAAEKPLYDALTRLGLLKDDSRKWVTRERLDQGVSADGTFWTVIVIWPVTNLAGVAVPS